MVTKTVEPASFTFQGKTLAVIGNSALIGQSAIGICGSRNASPRGLAHSSQFARFAVELGFVVVSGYARGVDSEAHRGAMSAGGGTIAVLAEGINSFYVRRTLKDHNPESRLTAVSEFDPNAKWTAWRAMDRNKLIVGLSKGLVVVEAGETGGTLAAGRECLRQRKPLLVLAYDRRSVLGNELLISEGGIPVRTPGELKAHLKSLKDES